jgi:hypothetical protein
LFLLIVWFVAVLVLYLQLDCVFIARILSSDPQVISVGVVLGTTAEMVAYLEKMNTELDGLASQPMCIQVHFLLSFF